MQGFIRVQGAATDATAQICPQSHALVLCEPSNDRQRQEAVQLLLLCWGGPCTVAPKSIS